MIITLDTEMPFGKYKGEKARSVAQYHYNYVLWAVENLTGISFSAAVLYIARAEKRAARGRQMAYAYMLPCRKVTRDWSRMEEGGPYINIVREQSGPDDDEDRDFDEMGIPVFDEYGGMSESDFGNN